jgi:hypothetical protein
MDWNKHRYIRIMSNVVITKVDFFVILFIEPCDRVEQTIIKKIMFSRRTFGYIACSLRSSASRFENYGMVRGLLRSTEIIETFHDGFRDHFIGAKACNRIADTVYDIVINYSPDELEPLVEDLKEWSLITKDRDDIYNNLCQRKRLIRAKRYLTQIQKVSAWKKILDAKNFKAEF